MIDDEKFYAWIDGELVGDEAERIAAEVAADPALAARARQHRKLGASLRGAFAPVMEQEVAPPRFHAEVVDFGARRTERGTRRAAFGLPQWAAMAATLAIGFFAGQFDLLGRDDGPVAMESGRLVASADLEQALYTRLASAPSDEGPRIGLTFRDRTGAICRTFDEGASSGLACQRSGDWEIDGLFASEDRGADYRMAAGDDARLAAMVDERIAGEPFDAVQERAVFDKGWR